VRAPGNRGYVSAAGGKGRAVFALAGRQLFGQAGELEVVLSTGWKWCAGWRLSRAVRRLRLADPFAERI